MESSEDFRPLRYRTRWFCYLDLLGFAALVNDKNIEQVIPLYKNALAEIGHIFAQPPGPIDVGAKAPPRLTRTLIAQPGELSLSIDPAEFSPNEAWLLFQLNSAPVRTEADGDFNVLAIMEVVSGMIFAMELVPLLEPEITELQSRKLFNAAETQAGARPRLLYVPSDREADRLTAVARTMRITVERVPSSEFAELIKEAVEGFATHVSGRRMQ